MNILNVIERFCDDHGISGSRFGHLAANDTMLIAQMRAGRQIGPKLEAELRTFMRDNRGKELRAPTLQTSPIGEPKAEMVERDYSRETALVASCSSDALLRALWREHPRILNHLAAQGRNVVPVGKAA